MEEVAEVTSKLSNVQLEKAVASPTLKLPPLFSLTPNSTGKVGNAQRTSLANQVENISERKCTDSASLNNARDNLPQGCCNRSCCIFNSYICLFGLLAFSSHIVRFLNSMNFCRCREFICAKLKTFCPRSSFVYTVV